MALISKLSSFIAPTLTRARLVNLNIKRMSHGRNMNVEGSNYALKKSLDLIHFYFSIGLITSIPVIIWVNLTHAPAELADIPEGYEPEHWEYDKHPIRRFLAKHVFGDPRIMYEQQLATEYLEREQEFIMRLKNRVESVMSKKQDSASWFYAPIDNAPSRIMIDDQIRDEAAGIVQIAPMGYHLEGPDPPADFQGIQESKRTFIN
ncbi:NADH dehydrogenase [ubiquinone] 1 beta subcomplex subunit 5, mitochondrial-like [Panonychus citri]|uniref:NADH dehydrogenase [ubiquinone] 1 beta subcomplex subunit 5, mitochondrial-like n=1 Tax=Panonychus citri TaxID=50023 RepID=UPI0023080EB6|nr:NADH dehydrogenase [ubiquinone] 1 beta subcomplex subunit 5, mitochondrial-like [Panonychus citri]